WYLFIFFFFFFFSSRRRHTRSLRDWSSDVCSSDLFSRELWTADATPLLRQVNVPVLVIIGKKDLQIDWQAVGESLKRAAAGHERSEERRVGKECRCRWSRCDYKKKKNKKMNEECRK